MRLTTKMTWHRRLLSCSRKTLTLAEGMWCSVSELNCFFTACTKTTHVINFNLSGRSQEARRSQCVPTGATGQCTSPDPAAVLTWSEEKLLELGTSLRRCEQSGTSRGAGGNERAQYSRSCCNITRDPESLQAEVAAARWAWLGPTLLVRAYEGSEQAMAKS